MIAVRLEGRLGNQLFQYAFIYAVSKKLNTRFYVDKSVIDFVLPRYFTVKTDQFDLLDRYIFSIKGFKNVFTYHLKRLFYNKLHLIIHLKKQNYQQLYLDPQTVLSCLENNVYYQGYFQSPLYFFGYEGYIRNAFSIRAAYRTAFAKKYAALYVQYEVVCVHIRRTDYLNLANLNLGDDDLSLPLNYYQKAISSVEGENIHFVFIGDDRQYIIENFKDITNKTITNESEIIDFQHLLNAEKCIISNSTFSWWGAWLNNKPNKIIYAPKFFLGWRVNKEVPKDIYPDAWVQIDF